jgi:phospholipase C
LPNPTTAILTVDEDGGYYDSGFIRPVDFVGTGPRIPMIAVLPLSRGAQVSQVYGEHSSLFVERNWYLGKLTAHSRDDLSKPRLKQDNATFP